MGKRKSGKPKPLTLDPVRARAIRGPHRDGSGRWYWRAETYQDGSSQTIWTGWALRDDAKRAIADLIARDDLRGVKERTSQIRTVRDLMEYWIASVALRSDLRPATVSGYRYASRHITTAIGDVKVSRVNQHVLDSYRDDRLRGGAATRTVFLDLETLRIAWRWARARGGEDRDLPKVALKVKPVRNNRTPTRDEVLRALAKLDGWASIGALLLFATGARLGEVSALRWCDLDLEGGWVRVSGKTGPREIPVTAEVIAMLRAMPDREPSGYVCGVKPGTVWNNLSRHFATACDLAKVPRFTPQGLRRFAVDEMARSGVDIGTACAVTGHSPGVMLTYYRRATTVDRRRAVVAARLGVFKGGKVVSFPGRAVGGDDD